MTTGQTQYGDIGTRTAAYAAEGMLAHAMPVMVLQKFALSKPQPKNKTDTVKFRRPVPFAAATTPLLEGVTPSAQKMAYEDVTAALKQYGAYVEITDKVMDQSEDPVLQNATELCGEQSGLTTELVTWGVLKGGSSVAYSNGSTRDAVNTPISKTLQQKITRSLKSQKARKITKILAGSTDFASSPVEAAYVAIGHTDLESDIRAMPGFVPVAKYGSRKVLCEEELGTVDDVRYILSPELTPYADLGGDYDGSGTDMVSTTGTKADVYPIMFLGKDAFGVVPLKGAKAITPMVVNPKPSAGDRLGQRGSVGWKAWFTAVRLNETWMHRAEVACTQL